MTHRIAQEYGGIIRLPDGREHEAARCECGEATLYWKECPSCGVVTHWAYAGGKLNPVSLICLECRGTAPAPPLFVGVS